MISKKYVVFKRVDGCEQYWTGEFQKDGRAAKTIKVDKAMSFMGARAAYDHAGKFSSMRYWRVGQR
jgi:hypothetical protein